MIKKLFITTAIFLSFSCVGSHKNKKLTYEDNVENMIVALYDQGDYEKYIKDAYAINSKDNLLYDVIYEELDYDLAKKIYSEIDGPKNGYDFLNEAEIEKSSKEENEIATRVLFEEYYFNFEFKKISKLLEERQITKEHILVKDFINNKEDFLEIEKIYNKMLKSKESIEEKEKFENFALEHKLNDKLVYDVTKKYLEKGDIKAKFFKYRVLDKSSVISKSILKELFDKNFGPAIREYIKLNGIYDYNNELIEKIEKYSPEAYIELLENYIEKGNINKIDEIVKKIPDISQAHAVRAYFYELYKSDEEAYDEYIKAYEYGLNLDKIINKLVMLSRKLNKEKEVLEITDNYSGRHNINRQELEYEISDNIQKKKKIALKIWCLDKKKAAELLINHTTEKEKIDFYTKIINAF